MGVAVSQVYQDVVELVLKLNNQIFPELLYFSKSLEGWVLFNSQHSLPEYRMEVQHDVFGCILLCLFFIELALAHELKSYRDYIADSLDKENLYLV